MKKSIIYKCLAVVLFIGLLWGCSIDDDGENVNFTYKLTPITAVKIPDTVLKNEQYTFRIDFEKPSECYSFSGFDYTENRNVRKISVVSSVILDDEGCASYDEPKIESQNLRFIAKRRDFYLFKFWQGVDSIGQAKYLTKKVIVADSI